VTPHPAGPKQEGGALMHLMEDVLAKLGSRIRINFQPRNRCVRYSPLGFLYDQEIDLVLGVRYKGKIRALPFTKKGTPVECIEQEITPTSIRFRARVEREGPELDVTFTAPWYPGDAKLSTAPFFIVDVTVRKNRWSHYWQKHDAVEGELVIGIGGVRPAPKAKGRSLRWQQTCKLVPEVYIPYPHERPIRPGHEMAEEGGTPRPREGWEWSTSAQIPSTSAIVSLDSKAKVKSGLLSVPFSTRLDEEQHFTFLWAGYIREPVMEVRGKQHRFKYTDFFKNVDAVLAYAKGQLKAIRRKVELLDRTLAAEPFGKATRDLTAYAMHSYMHCSWWTRAVKGRDEWFSVWEGNCMMHSTVDVEYNCSPILLMLWPELLEKTMSQHPHYQKPDGFFSHDMGALLQANTDFYHHEMEVEENCNYILMAYALWKVCDRPRTVDKQYKAILKALDYNVAADTTGDGIPDTGTANTVDDGSAAVQYSKEQTYLAVKALASFVAGSFIAQRRGDNKTTLRCRAQARKIARTVRKAWLGDHFPVCIDKEAEGIVDSWTGKPLPYKELPGWDAYTLYGGNGLLYLLMSGTAAGIDLKLFREDVVNATRESLCEYGCYHSSSDTTNLWISQNMWRDMVAGYLGVDLFNMADRYWAFEVYENTSGRGGCFTDTHGNNWLAYYPRGTAILGYAYAMAGVVVDREAKVVRCRPARYPLRIPLLTLADWAKGRIPVLDVRPVKGKLTATLEDLPGYTAKCAT